MRIYRGQAYLITVYRVCMYACVILFYRLEWLFHRTGSISSTKSRISSPSDPELCAEGRRCLGPAKVFHKTDFTHCFVMSIGGKKINHCVH